MKSGTGFRTWPLQGRQAFSSLSSPLSLNRCIVMCWYREPRHSDLLTLPMVRKQRPPSAAATARRNTMGVLRFWKSQTHLAHDRRKDSQSKAISFQVSCVYVCVCVSYPFSSLEKSAPMTDGFKICSPNFTLFKKWVKKPFFPNSYKEKSNKRLLSATGAIQINTAP